MTLDFTTEYFRKQQSLLKHSEVSDIAVAPPGAMNSTSPRRLKELEMRRDICAQHASQAQ
jgi:hypothetical protein